jgi:hypothetical protein
MWALPTHWTAAYTLVVFEVLDDLRDLVVDGYARKIRADRGLGSHRRNAIPDNRWC